MLAAAHRRAAAPVNGPGERELLLRRLAAQAPSFDFFQAVRMLLRGRGGLEPRRAVGAPDPVRFRANVSFQWKASDVQSIAPSAAPDGPATVTANFLGVASPGIVGSLPNWYAQRAIAEAADRDQPNPALLEFFALFDDRLLEFCFRAWLRSRLPVQYELQRHDPAADARLLPGVVERMLLGVVGFGTPGLAALLPLDPRALVHRAAMLARRPATPEALADSLSAWFGVPFAIEQFTELVVDLEPDQRCRLGDPATALGATTVLGDAVRMRQGKFRLRAGPLDWRRFAGFLPDSDGVADGAMLRELIAWVRQATGGEFDYDLQLVLREDSVPVLTFRPGEPERSRLGLSTWLGARLQGGAATDTVVQVSELESRRTHARRRAAASRP